MVMEGDLVIDDHQTPLELQEAMESAMKQVGVFREAAEKVEERDFEAAIDLIQDSELPEETRSRLVNILQTGEYDGIDNVFSEYKSRLGQAFCEGCWGDAE